MKKIAVILFTMLYLVSNSGLAINNFYCCGKFKETYIFHSKATPKNCKGNKLPGCCDTKTVVVKVKADHSPAQQLNIKANSFSFNIFSSAQIVSISFYDGVHSHISALSHAPPLISELPVYLSVCSFRI